MNRYFEPQYRSHSLGVPKTRGLELIGITHTPLLNGLVWDKWDIESLQVMVRRIRQSGLVFWVLCM